MLHPLQIAQNTVTLIRIFKVRKSPEKNPKLPICQVYQALLRKKLSKHE